MYSPGTVRGQMVDDDSRLVEQVPLIGNDRVVAARGRVSYRHRMHRDRNNKYDRLDGPKPLGADRRVECSIAIIGDQRRVFDSVPIDLSYDSPHFRLLVHATAIST